MIALIDINNSYISFEKVFQPKFENVPSVVLSNGDSCIIARSAEAKALGIKMAQPLYQIKELINKHNVKVFSSNYILYADLSNRFHTVVGNFGVRQERYSIDENFIDLTGIPIDGYGIKIKNTIKRSLGLPICVGMVSSS